MTFQFRDEQLITSTNTYESKESNYYPFDLFLEVKKLKKELNMIKEQYRLVAIEKEKAELLSKEAIEENIELKKKIKELSKFNRFEIMDFD